jgi:hypothetical protein
LATSRRRRRRPRHRPDDSRVGRRWHRPGGRLILAHETLGFLPNLPDLAATGVPIVEDVSQSAAPLLRAPGAIRVFSIIASRTRPVDRRGGALSWAPRAASPRPQEARRRGACDRHSADINAALAFVRSRARRTRPSAGDVSMYTAP